MASLITEPDNEATVAKTWSGSKPGLLEVLAEGWTEVPPRLADVHHRGHAGRSTGRVVGAGDAGYKLLIEKKGKQPEQWELVLEYAKAITLAGTEQRVVPGPNAGEPLRSAS